jgi:shikimate kinase
MTRVLITGMSGTGKSSVIERLAALGYRAIDADTPEWSEWAPMPAPGAFPGLAPELDWVWREDRLRQLLADSSAEPLFVSGCAPNQRRFHDRFDHIVLLSAPGDVLVDRLATRTTNQFGKTVEEREKILADLHEVEPLLRAAADVEIDTGATPFEDVVTQVIGLVSQN